MARINILGAPDLASIMVWIKIVNLIIVLTFHDHLVQGQPLYLPSSYCVFCYLVFLHVSLCVILPYLFRCASVMSP